MEMPKLNGTLRVWIQGLVSAFLSGAASGLTGYMMSDHPERDFDLLVAVSVSGGLIGAANYLRPSPIKPSNA